jgi:hypothetical protein
VKYAAMNAVNIKLNTARNVPMHANNAQKNAGKWLRNFDGLKNLPGSRKE